MSSTQQKQIYPSLKPQLKSLLDRHRILAPSAGVRVSPICLGAMNFGNAWKDFMGECSKETAWEMLDYFYDMGGNFIDTYVLSLRHLFSIHYATPSGIMFAYRS